MNPVSIRSEERGVLTSYELLFAIQILFHLTRMKRSSQIFFEEKELKTALRKRRREKRRWDKEGSKESNKE